MILTILLTIIAIIVIVVAIIVLTVGGVGFIVIFGDLIVCVVFITLLIKWIMKKRRER